MSLEGLIFVKVPFCGRCKREGEQRRCFGDWNKCAECYVYGHVDPVINVIEWREDMVRPLSDDYLRVRKTFLKARAFILASGGNSRRRDKRLMHTLFNALTKADKMLPQHPDEEEWLPDN